MPSVLPQEALGSVQSPVPRCFSNSLHICIEECVSVVPACMLNHHSICGSDTRTHFNFTSWSVFINTHNPYSSGKYVLKIQNRSFKKIAVYLFIRIMWTVVSAFQIYDHLHGA